MKKVFKIITIIIIALILIYSNMNISYAKIADEHGNPETYTEVDTTIEDGISQANNFLKDGKNQYKENSEMKSNLDMIFNVLVAVGTALAVIIGGILGIKFMIASAEDKAKIKEALIPYVLGCIVIFGAFAIWKLVVTVLNQIS